MSDIEYLRIDATHSAQARSIIAGAFAADPLIEWLFPPESGEDGRRLDAIAAFYWPSVEAYAALGTGHVAVYRDRVVGAALWSVPGSGQPGQTLPSATGMARLLLGDRLSQLAEGMRAARGEGEFPQGPYLHDLAVAADRRGEGIGATLIEAGLRDFGTENAWLETTSPLNHGLYERAGFAEVHSARIGASGVTMTRMVMSR